MYSRHDASKDAILLDRKVKWPTTLVVGHCIARCAMPLDSYDALAHDEKRILLGELRDATTLRRFQSKLLHVLHG